MPPPKTLRRSSLPSAVAIFRLGAWSRTGPPLRARSARSRYGQQRSSVSSRPSSKLTDASQVPRLLAGSKAVRLPYDRSRVSPGIVHLGVGAFHRAHVAVYVDEVLKSDPSWGIIGASLQRPDTRNALAPQDFLYTLV